ncbi:hypothetical protein AJ85_20830 [Alkalihalobacillus alcalophilus ATCC 27647 = CGMCC 1.3604]|uniref:DUF1694 domain-containing protein n=1 Tax=Alkalihalobacillus alcalophilus ATCC 27647 = CGMCC 1.3604 TaxID=1218173 RepID=A0A094YTP2_ALKAL|nr:YueI family protein [Alkalihalobacillus alcalophilus]KGA96837.1 hypothetical protein BALCAV_0213960 [Alkalihalobacillus alcalophilus ATCC 27647 = CGMCC 1.3604]MED1561226.1 YueI family protein [Alkalihalobacillus alcalophilus]THG88845.1 hypothetical protein AJ85_20830 [Alkalihalobacillus alcalophilus ATCC 27647 = CGMCC 1.3604]
MNEKVQEKMDYALRGTPQVKLEERNLFLTTIAERIFFALTLTQVQRNGLYDEIIQTMEKEKDLQLFINGHLPYSTYSKYVKIANSKGIRFTITTPNYPTPFGLVLATERRAIDLEQIFIEDEWYERDMEEHRS